MAEHSKNMISVNTGTVLSKGKNVWQVDTAGILFCDHHPKQASLAIWI